MFYDVYLNNDNPELWKSKRAHELLLLGLQKYEKKDPISLDKCGLHQIEFRDGEAIQQKQRHFTHEDSCFSFLCNLQCFC